MTDMTIPELNTELVKTSRAIALKSNEATKTRLEYLNAKDEYERDYSKTIIRLKTINSNLTQTDLKAMAIDQTYEKKLEWRTKEGKYRALMSDLKALNSMLESLQEVSYNLRAELKLTR